MSETAWCEACNQEHRNELCPESRPVQPDTDALILELRAVNEAVMDRAVDYIRVQQATIASLEEQVESLQAKADERAETMNAYEALTGIGIEAALGERK